MRTTLTLDDDIAAILVQQSQLRGVSMGRTASDLIRRGLQAPTPTEVREGVRVFKLPSDSPQVTTQGVRRIEAEGL